MNDYAACPQARPDQVQQFTSRDVDWIHRIPSQFVGPDLSTWIEKCASGMWPTEPFEAGSVSLEKVSSLANRQRNCHHVATAIVQCYYALVKSPDNGSARKTLFLLWPIISVAMRKADAASEWHDWYPAIMASRMGSLWYRKPDNANAHGGIDALNFLASYLEFRDSDVNPSPATVRAACLTIRQIRRHFPQLAGGIRSAWEVLDAGAKGAMATNVTATLLSIPVRQELRRSVVRRAGVVIGVMAVIVAGVLWATR